MLRKHSITVAVLCLALSSATASISLAQVSAGVGVGGRSALLSQNLRGGADFQTSPGLNKHVQAALVLAKKIGVEVGFGFYTNSNLGLEYVPGEIRNDDGATFYKHLEDWQTEDVGLLVAKFGGSGANWKWVGDAHVHEGKEENKRVQQHKGVPSLEDLKGELRLRIDAPRIMMTIASRKWVKGFDASMVFRHGALAARSGDYAQVVKHANDKSKPQSHPQAMNILGDAYSGKNIAYFSGSFKGKRSQIKSGEFKYKGNP